MRSRLISLTVVAALSVIVLVPAAGADTENGGRDLNGTLTFRTFPTEFGTVRGVFADFNLVDFESSNIDDSSAGGIVVQLRDSSGRTLSQVSLREGALNDSPGVPTDTKALTAPIDSVWGTFDYAADGYWTQPRNLRINGGNCEQIAEALVTIRLQDGDDIARTIQGAPHGSCDDIRR